MTTPPPEAGPERPLAEPRQGVAAALAELRQAVEAALDAALPTEDAWPAEIHRATRYSLFAGGKRLRPLLALAASDAVGGAREEALPFACAVELVHTYSLIHDDLPAMDDDDLRRGRPTCHKVFGEATAILAGDALLTRAFHLLAEVPDGWDAERLGRRLRATAVLGEACGSSGLIGGQVVDLAFEGRTIDAATLERIHAAKTGALLSACVRGGAVLGGADAATLAALGRYAAAIGLAFQVVDDLLDATESSATLGKTAGKDRHTDKATYVKLYGVEATRAKARALLAQALEALAPLAGRAAVLAELARRMVERHA